MGGVLSFFMVGREGAMRKGIKKSQYPMLALTLLVLLACNITRIGSSTTREDCEAKGGTWREHYGKDGKLEGYCEFAVYTEGKQCVARTVSIDTKITRSEVNEFGTRICDYNIKFSTTDPKRIWLMAYRHEADVWQDLDEYEWIPLNVLESETHTYFFSMDQEEFDVAEWSGYYIFHTDPEATGPSLLTLDKYIGIYDTPDCAPLRFDDEYLEKVAINIPPTCPP